MRSAQIAVVFLALISAAEAKSHYYHPASITAITQDRDSQTCVIDSPLGIFTAKIQRSFRRKPHFGTGPIRVSIEPNARVSDNFILLDENDTEYRGVILKLESPPPPRPTF